MGLRMKNFNILGVHWKIWFLRGSWKANIEGGLPKKGAWTVCRFKGGAWEERGDGVNTQSSWIIRTISGCLVLLELFADLRGEGGGLGRKRGWCYWGVVDTPMHTMGQFQWPCSDDRGYIPSNKVIMKIQTPTRSANGRTYFITEGQNPKLL